MIILQIWSNRPETLPAENCWNSTSTDHQHLTYAHIPRFLIGGNPHTRPFLPALRDWVPVIEGATSPKHGPVLDA